jgi:hypothetical protein
MQQYLTEKYRLTVLEKPVMREEVAPTRRK